MSYAAFLAIFVVPPLLALAVALHRRITRAQLRVLAGVALVASVSAYPWDRAAVLRGYWSFDPARVLAWVGPLPVEECAFFALEAALVGLLTVALRSAR